MTMDELGRLLVSQFPSLVTDVQVGADRVRAILRDGSFVDIWFNARGKYSYHWQRESGAVFRFNNAPHHPAVPTHPHHLHAGTEEHILASPVRGVTEEDVGKVMDFVGEHMPEGQGDGAPDPHAPPS